MEHIDSVRPPVFDFDDEKEGEAYEEQPSRVPRRVYVYRTIGALVIAGLIYITGVQQALFYQRTPLGVPQEETESLLDAETVVVPLRVFVFRNNENFGSERSVDDIRQMVRNASEIWNQADVTLTVERIIFLDTTDADIGLFFDSPGQFVSHLDDYDRGAVNVFLSRSLKGIPGVNGIAFTGIRAVAVADLTTVYDFRVLAHEVGHILGLSHTSDTSQLMYQGANGFDITAEEALRARESAVAL